MEIDDKSQVSDGYHTLAELYEHRHALFLALMKSNPKQSWISLCHSDGCIPFNDHGWFIAGMTLDGKDITYHLPARLWGLAVGTGASVLPLGREWDGHTAEDVVTRLMEWVAAP